MVTLGGSVVATHGGQAGLAVVRQVTARFHDEHVWVWSHNPSGMFVDWNPELTCA